MSDANRHFGKFTSGGPSTTGEEVVILGYSPNEGNVLVCFLNALTVEEARTLRNIASSTEAQNKDFLMPVLFDAHHSSGVDWGTFLIRSAASSQGRTVRRATLKEVEFYDSTQKAYYSGYGPSIEPEKDAMRKAKEAARQAIMNGDPFEPSDEQVRAFMEKQAVVSPPLADTDPIPAVEAPTQAVDPNMALIAQSLAALAEGQAAMADAISKLKPAKAAPRRKSTTPRKPRAKKAGAETPAPAETAPVSDPNVDSTSYGDPVVETAAR